MADMVKEVLDLAQHLNALFYHAKHSCKRKGRLASEKRNWETLLGF